MELIEDGIAISTERGKSSIAVNTGFIRAIDRDVQKPRAKHAETQRKQCCNVLLCSTKLILGSVKNYIEVFTPVAKEGWDMLSQHTFQAKG